MRNVTITLDEETAKWVRIEAARHDTSVSRWVGQMLEERRRNSHDYERAQSSYLQRRSTRSNQPVPPCPPATNCTNGDKFVTTARAATHPVEASGTVAT